MCVIFTKQRVSDRPIVFALQCNEVANLLSVLLLGALGKLVGAVMG